LRGTAACPQPSGTPCSNRSNGRVCGDRSRRRRWLAISRRLVRLMGGDPTVRTEAEGSAFILWSPIAFGHVSRYTHPAGVVPHACEAESRDRLMRGAGRRRRSRASHAVCG
jgi:hypothetical protein